MAGFVEKGGLVEHFRAGLESLPAALKRNYALITELDSRVDKISQELKKLQAEFMAVAASLSDEEREERFRKMESLLKEKADLTEDKCQLANQAYDLVDKRCRWMDKDLGEFEAEVERKFGDLSVLTDQNVTQPGLAAIQPQGALKPKPERRKKWGRRRKPKTATVATTPAPAAVVPEAVPGPSSAVLGAVGVTQFDMPVDPNEPTYCICNQVSYGEMIGCENHECPIEWFHFPCMNLTAKPKGKWWCPTCAPDFDPNYHKLAEAAAGK